MDKKFKIALLKEVENKDELEYVWKLIFTDSTYIPIDLYKEKTALLKEAMGNALYFDVPSDPGAEYSVINSMFLSFNWKHANKIDTIKRLVSEL